MSLPTIPSTMNLAEACQAAPVPTASSADTAFAKFDFRTGDFLYGRDQADITGETVLVHTPSMQHGWTVWVNNKPKKTQVSFTQPLPLQPDPIDGEAWSESRAIMFAFDDGGQAILEGNSYGVRSGVDDLIIAIKTRAADPANANHLFPKVELGSSSYTHSTGNLIHNPVFKVVAWCDEAGTKQGDMAKLEEVLEEKEEAPTPVKRRRRA